MMPTDIDLEEFTDLPPEIVLQIHRSLLEEEGHVLTAIEAFIESSNLLADRYDEGIRSLASEDQWQKYERLHTRRVRHLLKLRSQLGEDPEISAQLREFRQKSIEQSVNLFEREGIDTGRLREIQADYLSGVDAALDQMIGNLIPQEVDQKERDA